MAVLQYIVPNEKIDRLSDKVSELQLKFREKLQCVFESAIFQPLYLGKIGCKCVFSLGFLIFAIVTALLLSVTQYGAFYYVQIPKYELKQSVQFAPVLLQGQQGKHIQSVVDQGDILTSTLIFQNSGFGQMEMNSFHQQSDIQKRLATLSEETSSIQLSPEQYNVALDLEVTESVYNLEQGKVFVTAHFIPCD